MTDAPETGHHIVFPLCHVTVVRLLPSLSVFFRVHPEICHRGGSKGAGGGRGRLLLRELHVRLFGGRGSGHGVVVKGGDPVPFTSQQTVIS